MEHILNLHMRAAETVLDAVGEAAGSQGMSVCRITVPRRIATSSDYRPVDAHAREVAAVLESRDIEPRFHYPRG
ncbi:hypothetical protein PMO90_09415 [Bifidobacterium pseudocatenulatum]|uniref:hypothetical protein n=2 Tax=Bifidobacterium pseudocatenulatum TaxID=28026 RepID=UPI00189C2F91|nr:hypothetical protein [Bifidobacterium pseudocatenulatum]MDB6519333.1 hypothetical protein [Bifidobacterium pseudocatenulatum]MDB6522780.1 hypothetical protein [Bifidobacterium pseudocatenulatum]MDB6524549.1 hypothetical protein [Bifidobacterium pseudocatenulatum]MDB6526359.1 hypothetical protein [Bifidobacterium pseudocatenulatum]MDB6528202.1 hypothetical protein [Bifidobacterium pseudocatenulatum]